MLRDHNSGLILGGPYTNKVTGIEPRQLARQVNLLVVLGLYCSYTTIHVSQSVALFCVALCYFVVSEAAKVCQYSSEVQSKGSSIGSFKNPSKDWALLNTHQVVLEISRTTLALQILLHSVMLDYYVVPSVEGSN